MRSASDNASVVQEYLKQEVNLGPIDGSVSLEMVPIRTQLSLFGVIPKSNQPRKWCLIVDLSSPERRSENHEIEADICSLNGLHLDEVMEHKVKKGRNGTGENECRKCISHGTSTTEGQTTIGGPVG